MQRTPAQSAELVDFAAQRSGRARVAITGRSMMPLLRAGMVVDVASLDGAPRCGDILVYRTRRGLTAHRCVRRNRDCSSELQPEFVTAGDAFPHHVEYVPAEHVVGRVVAVWSDATGDARRVDGRFFTAFGMLLARTRAARAAWRAVPRYAKLLTHPREPWPSGIVATLQRASKAFERAEYAAGLALLRPLPARDVVAVAKRHHLSGVLYDWLRAAARGECCVPDDLFEPLRRIQWTNALRAQRVLTCLCDVRDRFEAASIPNVVLKGGARLATGDAAADLHYAGDLDVMVPTDLAARALHVLRSGGYVDVWSRRRQAQYAEHHHREPLRSPEIDVPVEIHTSLAAKPLVSEDLSFARFETRMRRIDGPIGVVNVLDPVEAALHLAYHGRDLRVWRDVVLLARALRAFDADDRRRFDAYVAAESVDGLRLASAVAAANELAFGTPLPAGAIRRYVRWTHVREEMPRTAPSNIVESIVGGSRVTMLRRDHSPDTQTWLLMWLRELVFLPTMALVYVRSASARRT